MVLILMRVIGIGIETADMLVKEIFSRNLRDRPPWRATEGLRGRPTKADRNAARKGLPTPAMHGCAEG
jgi:transposase